MFKVPEQFRITSNRNPMYNSTKEDGNNGAFAIKRPIKNSYGMRDKHGNLKKPNRTSGYMLYFCLASDQAGWEHVSVSVLSQRRLPSWQEMCDIKAMFWDPEDVVVQYHPAEKDYVNNAQVLHLWRPVGQFLPTPPSELVGIKQLGEI